MDRLEKTLCVDFSLIRKASKTRLMDFMMLSCMSSLSIFVNILVSTSTSYLRVFFTLVTAFVSSLISLNSVLCSAS